MPVLDSKWFNPHGCITPNYATKLEIASLGAPVSNTLTSLGWDGTTPVASIGIELAPDNKTITRAQFLLRGRLCNEPINKSATAIWGEAAKDITLKADIPDGSRFLFNNGTLTSDPLAGEEMKFHLTKGNDVVQPTEWPALGIKDFSIRCVAHLDKNSNKREGPLLKYTVLLIPLSVSDLQQLEPASNSSAWPGFKLCEGSCRFFPATDQSTWGEPICPLICRGSHVSNAPYLPPTEEIRYNIAAVMRTARLAVPCKTANGWRKQQQKAEEDISQLEKQPLITWPDAPRHQPPQGRLTQQCILHLSLTLSL
jgi:hypothetical protein